MERKDRGTILKGMVKIVEKRGGPEALIKLKTLFGGDLKFSSVKDYPTEVTIKLNSAIAQVLFGEDTDNTQFEIGKLMVDMYLDTVIGKTVLALLGDDLKTLAANISKIFGTFVTGVNFEVVDMGDKSVKIIMRNDPFPVGLRRGILVRMGEIYNVKEPRLETNLLGPETCEYLCSWK